MSNRRRLMLRQDAGGGGFSPLDLSWLSVAWAEDPAESPTNGDLLTTWNDPGTVGTGWSSRDGSNRVQWNSSAAALNGKPAFSNETASSWFESSTFTAEATPFTVVFIGTIDNTTLAVPYAVRFNTSSANAGLSRYLIPSSNAWSARNTTFRFYNAGVADNNAHLHIVEFDTAATRPSVDASAFTIAFAGSDTVTKLFLGLSDYGTSNVYALAGLMDGSISAGDRADLLDWSQTYYGTP